MYVLIREDGKYVAPPGREMSYTDRLQYALVFATIEQARSQKCESETIVSVEEIFQFYSPQTFFN